MPIASLVSSTRFIRLGDNGPAVTAIQLALKKIGYSLSGTGYYGQGTNTAVETFQKRAGLDVDGVVGPDTAAALDKATAPVTGATPTPVIPPEQISRPLWLEAGIKLIGTKEVPGSGDNPALIDWAKDLGGDIAKEYTHDSIPWCALFANHCLSQVGIKGTGTLWALDFAGKWPSAKLIGPAVGAFAPMVRTGGGHIVQVVGKRDANYLMCLGGNQSDAVNIEAFPMSRLNKGFWWPSSVPLPKQIGMGTLPVVDSRGNVISTSRG